jgi:hypothetical protein
LHTTEDIVLLDGAKDHVKRWPLELAESLLADDASWGIDDSDWLEALLPEKSTKKKTAKRVRERDRFHDFYKLVTSVNGYNRHADDYPTWTSAFIQSVKAEESCERHTTQELLDAVFIICRNERFVDGLIVSNEPQLRFIIQEVVRRVRSNTPPTFITVRQDSNEDPLA